MLSECIMHAKNLPIRKKSSPSRCLGECRNDDEQSQKGEMGTHKIKLNETGHPLL